MQYTRLNRNFHTTKTELCLFQVEFRAAYHQVIQSKERRLIVIIKDKVPDLGSLDEDLKLFIASNTYLRWSDPFFWRKLREALAPKITS